MPAAAMGGFITTGVALQPAKNAKNASEQAAASLLEAKRKKRGSFLCKTPCTSPSLRGAQRRGNP